MRDGSGRCEKHKRTEWAKKPDAPRRITGRRLQAARDELFRRDPLCAWCKAKGLVRLATQRDHIRPLSEGGEDVPENTQGLCDDCHAEKSLAERVRAQMRARAG